MIPKKDCIRRRVYKIHSRNLSYGVYDGHGGFIGIRIKFGLEYLFTEYHYDNGPPYGTVKPAEDTKIDMPESIQLNANTELFDFLKNIEEQNKNDL